LNELIELSNGAHIFYPYEDRKSYINNALSYIVSGIEQKHHMLVIESQEIFLSINEELNKHLTSKELAMVSYTDNYEFYRLHGDFNPESILNNFTQMLDGFIQKDISIRIWAHVDWKEQDDILSIITEYEDRADCLIRDAGVVSVCAYNAKNLTVPLQMRLMRNHEYFMSDKELVRSPLYKNANKTVIFPSLSVQK
jgi:hypothetical protein